MQQTPAAMLPLADPSARRHDRLLPMSASVEQAPAAVHRSTLVQQLPQSCSVGEHAVTLPTPASPLSPTAVQVQSAACRSRPARRPPWPWSKWMPASATLQGWQLMSCPASPNRCVCTSQRRR